jgi:hypothetical protein
MGADLGTAVRGVLQGSDRPLTSAEIAARVRQPRPAVEELLEALRVEPGLVVCEWPIADPHFGLDRLVVAAWVDRADDAALRAAEQSCQRVYDDLLRDFLASHRCV